MTGTTFDRQLERSENATTSAGGILLPQVPRIVLPESGVFRTGETTCYDTQNPEARAKAIDEIQIAGNSILRIVGSCTTDQIYLRTLNTMLKALKQLEFSGTILIGGTETSLIDDPGAQRTSIPALGPVLERRLHSDDRFVQSFSTVPFGDQSILTDNSLIITSDLESQHQVRLNRAAKQALIYPGHDPYVWNLEARGVTEMIHELLIQNPHLHYDAVFIGGGRATDLELKETLSQLKSEFPDRVHVTLLFGGGGATDQAILHNHTGCSIAALQSSSLRDALAESFTIRPEISAPTLPGAEASSKYESKSLSPSRRYNEVLSLLKTIDGISSSTAAQFATPLIEIENHVNYRQCNRLSAIISDQVGARTHTEVRSLEELINSSHPQNSGVIAPDVIGRIGHELTRQGDLKFAPIAVTDRKQLRPLDVIINGTEPIFVTRPALPHFDSKSILIQGVSCDGSSVTFSRLVDENHPLHAYRSAALNGGFGSVQRETESAHPSAPPPVGTLLQNRNGLAIVLAQSAEETIILAPYAQGWACSFVTPENAALFWSSQKVVGRLPLQDLIQDPLLHAPRPLSIEAALKAINPVEHFAVGTLVDIDGLRSIVVEGPGGIKQVVNSDKTGRFLAESALTHCGASRITPLGSSTSQILQPLALKSAPDAPAGWLSLENGGVINYLDAKGAVVAHEEILAMKPGGDDYTTRNLTTLRVDHRTGCATLAEELRTELSLTVPPSWLPDVHRVEVYSTRPAGPRASTDLPSSNVIRAELGWSHDLTRRFDRGIDRIESVLQIDALTHLSQQIDQRLNHPTAESMSLLKGIDPEFEALLIKQKEIHTIGRAVKEDLREWCSLISTLHPDRLTDSGPLHRLLSKSLQNLGDAPQDQSVAVQDLAQSIQRLSYTSDAHPSVRACAERFTMNLLRLAHELPSRVELISSTAPEIVVVDAGRPAPHILAACEQLATARVISSDKSRALKPADFRGHGGFVDSEFTASYLDRSIRDGAVLLAHFNPEDKGTRGFSGFALFYPAGKVPERIREHFPSMDAASAYYEVVCASSSAAPTARLHLARAAMCLLQSTDSHSMTAMIHESNLPSARSAIGDLYQPDPSTSILVRDASLPDQPGEGAYQRFMTWRVPLDPTTRSFEDRDLLARQDRIAGKAAAQSLRSQGFLSATGAEREQMLAISREHTGEHFTRFALGVGSFTTEGIQNFEKLIQDGVFDSLAGIMTWGATEIARLNGERYVLEPTGGHYLMQQIAARNLDDVTPVGYVMSDPRDPKFGTTVTVHDAQGKPIKALAIHTDNEAGTQITVSKSEQHAVIRGVAGIPDDYDGNLRLWHLEGLRGFEFGEHFRQRTHVFAGGGGTIRWEIDQAIERFSRNESDESRIILITGFGGATDAFAANSQRIDEIRALEAKLGRQILHIVDPMKNPTQLTELLQS